MKNNDNIFSQNFHSRNKLRPIPQKKKYRKLSIALKTVYRNGSFSMPKRKLLSGARENFLSRKKIRTHTPAKKGPRAIENYFLSRFRFFLKKLGNGLSTKFGEEQKGRCR